MRIAELALEALRADGILTGDEACLLYTSSRGGIRYCAYGVMRSAGAGRWAISVTKSWSEASTYSAS